MCEGCFEHPAIWTTLKWIFPTRVTACALSLSSFSAQPTSSWVLWFHHYFCRWYSVTFAIHRFCLYPLRLFMSLNSTSPGPKKTGWMISHSATIMTIIQVFLSTSPTGMTRTNPIAWPSTINVQLNMAIWLGESEGVHPPHSTTSHVFRIVLYLGLSKTDVQVFQIQRRVAIKYWTPIDSLYALVHCSSTRRYRWWILHFAIFASTDTISKLNRDP